MQEVIKQLRSPQTIRDRASILFDLAQSDQLSSFRCHLSKLPDIADYVIEVIRAEYPDLNVPFHSRWRHFEVGGNSRLEQLQRSLSGYSDLEQAKSKLDLAIISVLLDAGAGVQWHYQEPNTANTYNRSEGLAVASFHSFCQGLFSSTPKHPYQVDSLALQNLTQPALETAFQVTPENPLVGISGRLNLLQKLGKVLSDSPQFFPGSPPRPSDLIHGWLVQTENNRLSALTILQTILESLGEIWPGRLTLNGVNLGDVWQHTALPKTGIGSQFIPFHKLSQWLTYSLLEPLQELGLTITDLNQLTGLPEYRNGGLFLDLGGLEIKDQSQLTIPHKVDSELIIEWRALTVILLDKLTEIIRQKLNLTADEFPLVKLLQGGSWTAGRKIAAQLRSGGVPPLFIDSDGTVF
ncbi:MAG: URC4/urg3 family protein [Roseofilum sp. SBFL]|uniref:URC4/urg3 family protein n=1 Tax=unclassified Roseofilum TaxID=2620099 RepID=UPI001B0F5574|nr:MULTISPECIES: URC4/urg3 family protein [unclassified Roseofilum]MBP0013079.1 URC4/urg3 family protein [Roseofilum sp. SID3]MBP0025782.1 URC4/urg3 family protein [Roseofilum sp. SID2]MBP0038588.1 URC4/urg3 family protein [Roseofilum sp. SID1]MBP0042431.1 URC4/urg3 family protein [Roseofilum sp. SBFL]